MVTGVETAGLVLAALPFIVVGLEHYNEGLKPFKDLVNFEALIYQLASKLEVERIHLYNALERLLSNIVSDSDTSLLLRDPKLSAWKEEKLVLGLQRRLRGSYNVYLDIITRLSKAFEDFTHKIGLDLEGKMARDTQDLGRIVDDCMKIEDLKAPQTRHHETLRAVRDHATWLHSTLQTALSCNCDVPHHTQLRLEERKDTQNPSFRVTFSMPDTASIDTSLIWHETDLKVLGNTTTSSPARDRATGIDDVHARPASAAQDLSIAVHDSASGNMHQSHSHLRIPAPNLKKSGRKRVSWALIPGIQAANIGVTSANSANETPSDEESRKDLSRIDEVKPIDSLCAIFRSAVDRPLGSCLGRLESEKTHFEVVTHTKGKHLDLGPWNLHDLLRLNRPAPWETKLASWNGPKSAGQGVHLTKKARLELAVILASTILQLHTTPWLKSDWNGKCIRFRHDSLDHPYISMSFPNSKERGVEEASEKLLGLVQNRGVYGLGVFLLELSIGKPLADYQSTEQGDLLHEFLNARQLLDGLKDEESPDYYRAARACIFCNFGSELVDMDLSNDSFRRAIYEQVVLPLEQALAPYRGRQWRQGAEAFLAIPH